MFNIFKFNRAKFNSRKIRLVLPITGEVQQGGNFKRKRKVIVVKLEVKATGIKIFVRQLLFNIIGIVSNSLQLNLNIKANKQFKKESFNEIKAIKSFLLKKEELITASRSELKIIDNEIDGIKVFTTSQLFNKQKVSEHLHTCKTCCNLNLSADKLFHNDLIFFASGIKQNSINKHLLVKGERKLDNILLALIEND
jgi:hypothetical protein